ATGGGRTGTGRGTGSSGSAAAASAGSGSTAASSPLPSSSPSPSSRSSSAPGSAGAPSGAGSGTGAGAGGAAGGATGNGPLPGAGSGSRALPPESGGSGAITSLRDLRELPELRKGVPPRTLAIVAVAVVVVIVVVVLLVVNAGGDDKDGNASRSGSAGTSADEGGRGAAKAQEAGAGTGRDEGGSARDAGGGAGGDGRNGAAEDAGLPEGYARVKDKRFHFSVALPDGWKRTGIAGRNSGGKYAAPGGGHPRIQIDHTGTPGSDAAGAWRKQEPAVRGASPGYKSLGIRTVGWRGYPTVADWHFLRKENGKKVHVLNRGFKVDAENGYAILITCEADAWQDKECETLRKTAFRTFKPL
ncbi:serine/threonine protein kinase, partial [Streptomyces albus subsp. chlorinus]|nr:serine/threonine protein kinase [Streptomyces albus subsp. chlorinus]